MKNKLIKHLKRKFQKVDFVIPLIIGALLTWWVVNTKEYVGVFLIPPFFIWLSSARLKFIYGTTDKYKKEFVENSKKRQEEWKKRPWYDNFRYGAGAGNIIMGSAIAAAIIFTLLYFSFKSLSDHNYPVFFVTTFIVTTLIFAIRHLSKNIILDILIGAIGIMVFALFLILN